MTQITNGRLVYTRRINTGNYEHREVVADFSFSVAEGASAAAIDAFINQTGNLAKTKAEQLAKGETLPDRAVSEQVAQPVGQSEVPKRGPGRPPKVQSGDAPFVAASSTTAPVDDLDGPAVKLAGKIEDDLGDVTGAQPTIDDKTLVDHITHTNQRIKNAAAIRALIAEFVGPPPATTAKIPQERRQEFINKLEGLK